MAARIIVIGGGFAGVKCAKNLRKHLGKDEFEIVLIASDNHMVFHPLLAEVASAALNPKDMAAPLRALVKDVRILMQDVTDINLEQSEISCENVDYGSQKLKYDQLILACGNTSNLAVVPGMADHAFPMKTVGDALALQLHVINQMERAETCTNADKKKDLLTFVIVGGGFSGVEVAGEIHDFVSRSARYYSNFSKEDINVVLVHSRDQILPEVSSSLREFARSEMAKHGVRLLLNTGASYCTGAGVGLRDGEFVRAGTVVCTIGTRPSPVVERLSVPKDRGRIKVNADMSIPGFANAWAIGDCAAVPNAFDGEMSPTTGQFAERQGAQVALNVSNRLHNEATKPFRHRSLGVLCSIGGKKAVAESMGLKFSGFIAWVMWRGTYLFKLPSIWQQIGVGLTWLLGLCFPPALMALRTDPSKRVGNAHYRAGDWIFRQGEPATDFYVLKEGQVEIINEANGEEYVIAILGAGDFFGEASLIGNTLHSQSCRARTDIEMLVLGKSVFEQISHSLEPLRSAIGTAIKRRQISWQGNDELTHALSSLQLSKLIDSPTGLLAPSSTLHDAIAMLNAEKLDLLYVVDNESRLKGVVTRTDLMQALDSRTHLAPHDTTRIAAETFMVNAPICAAVDENLLPILLTMREHGFKRIPVVDNHNDRTLLGSLRVERVLAAVMENVMTEPAVQP